MTKICYTCKSEYPLSQYHKNGRAGLKGQCKYCIAKVRKKHSNGRVGREAERRAHLKARYGISLEDYDNMMNFQGNSCALCGLTSEKLNVDHDHITGAVRGLLCGSCNRGLGLLKDNKDILAKAIKYLDY